MYISRIIDYCYGNGYRYRHRLLKQAISMRKCLLLRIDVVHLVVFGLYLWGNSGSAHARRLSPLPLRKQKTAILPLAAYSGI